MSIIYDALKKVEKTNNRDIISEVNKESSGPKLTTYLLYVLVVCAGLFVANVFFGVISPIKTKTAQPVKKIAESSRKELKVPKVESA